MGDDDIPAAPPVLVHAPRKSMAERKSMAGERKSVTERRVKFAESAPVVVLYQVAPTNSDSEDEQEEEKPPAAPVAPVEVVSPPPPPAEEPKVASPLPPPPAFDDSTILPPSPIHVVKTSEVETFTSDAKLKRPIKANSKTTCNSMELAILTKQTTNLWAHRRTAHTPASLSTSLEVTYCPMKAVANAFYTTQHELKTQDDILVCSPQRSGQTAILEALFHLCNQHGDSSDKFVDYVGWIGSAAQSELPVSKTSSGKRLFKTHMNLQPFTRTGQSKAPKIIVVLRDPFYMLDSWYRHVLDVYGMFNDDRTAVEAFTLEDFKECMPGANNAGLAASNDSAGETYWKFTSLALDLAAKDKNVKIVFYEQIISDPEALVDQLSEFVLGIPCFDDELKRDITGMWKKKRNNANKLQVPPALRLHLGEAWIKHFSAAFIQGMPTMPSSYYDLFLNMTGARTYPLPTFPFTKERAMSRFSVIRRNVSSGNIEAQQEIKQLKSRAGSVVMRLAQATISTVTGNSTAAAVVTSPSNSRSNSLVDPKPKRKSVYQRVFG